MARNTLAIEIDLDVLAPLWIVLGIGLLLYSADPEFLGDGQARFEDLTRMAKGQAATSKYSVIQPLLAWPLYELGSLFGARARFVQFFNCAAFTLMIAAIWRLLPEKRDRFSVIVFVMAASMMPYHLQAHGSEIMTAATIVAGLLAMLSSRRAVGVVAGAVLVAIGAANTPATVPAVLLAFAFLAWRRRDPLYLLPVLFAAALVFAEIIIRFGGLAGSPYLAAGEAGFATVMPYSGLPGFSYPLGFGLLAIVFSFGKGLLFFAPGAFLRHGAALDGMSRDQRDFTDALLVLVIGLVLTYARWWAWYGGFGWGPRFFIIVGVPAAVLMSHALRRRRSILLHGAIALSLWVCIQGYVYGARSLDVCIGNSFALEHLCWYAPEFSPLWRQFVVGFGDFRPERLAFAGWAAVSVAAVVLCAWRSRGSAGRATA